MSFQYVFDNATQISISKRKNIAQTISRGGVVKATSLGAANYEFIVSLPDGPKWSDNRRLIELVDSLDRTTVDTVQISNPGMSYIAEYQGDLTNVTGVTVSYTSGNTVTITGGATLGSGFRFRAGDYIQLGSASVYTVVEDVAFNVDTITVHRPIREAVGGYTLKVGTDVSWDIICVSMPTWTIFGYNQVSWSGEFVFAEAL